MTDSLPGTPRPAPAWKPLEPNQRRVLGVMIEKAKTTPGAYPLTVNAIVVGSNQKNNRDPVTALDDFDVEKALDELGRLGVASEIDWLGRVPKYKHHAYDWLGVNGAEMAVMAELLLRGAQPLGDLRARAARMEPIADLAALKPIVDGLVARGLMIELSTAGRGQIVSHNLYTAQELAELRARHGEHRPGPGSPGREEPARHPAAPAPTRAPAGDAIMTLSAELADLKAEVARLGEKVRSLEARLDGAPGLSNGS